MNGKPSMNDDEVLAAVRETLTAVRDSLGEVRMRRPAQAIITGGRARRARRRLAVRAAVAGATAVITAAIVLGVTGGDSRGGAPQARTIAYVTKRVENALASENLVYVGRTDSKVWGNAVTWAYGSQSQFEEFWPATDNRDRAGNGQRLWDFPPADRGLPYLASGTALVGGKLVGAYVTYFDRKYSLSALGSQPASACSTTAALSMGGPLWPTPHWSAFINATLACGAAAVTGHVPIDGVETTQITGKPVTVELSAGYAKTVGAKWATARWTLYVNPKTYLPVRSDGSTQTYGGPAAPWTSSAVTDVQWLAPTATSIAKTLISIPPGFQRVASAADQ
jgi:hypothetical protein